MKRLQTVVFVVLAGVSVLFSGCASTKVKRIAVDKQVDFSGRWNDTDSQKVADAMIADCTMQSWQPMFLGQKNRPPVVIVGDIKNQSSEHINSEVFTKALERSLLNSGKVQFVASKTERFQVRDERNDQQDGNTSAETMKRKGQETGADFILIGSINSVKDETKGRYVVMYQVNLELIDLETNRKVWLGSDSIKKVVEKSKYSL
ncbi:MAG: penicillin-binding protein activator LpoB [Candidatus Omnitrophica bacterium]|nr:penicillin-binding protein activator LpoB [Candidatus Omnitrophota bacterium]